MTSEIAVGRAREWNDLAIRWATKIPDRFPHFPFTGDVSQEREKTLDTRERESLLKIIAALIKHTGQ